MTTSVISPLLRPNGLPQKGVAIPKFDLRSIWEAVEFQPHAGQQRIFEGWKFHQVTTAVCGTRFGKSTLAAHLPLAYIAPCWREEIVNGRRVLVEHRTAGAIIAPIYKLTSIIMDQLFELILKLCKLLGYPITRKKRTRFFDDDGGDDDEIDTEPGYLTVRRINGIIQTIITPWGNRIDAFTMENPKGLLGVSFDWIITDESGQFQEKEWNNFLEYAVRALWDRKGWMYHGTTPKGFNALYDKYFVPGLEGEQREPDYVSFQMPSATNDRLDKDWLENERRRQPARLFAMNYEAQFTVLEGQVYEEFSRALHVRSFTPRPEWLYFLGMDFGFTHPFVCQLWAWTGEAFACIDEVYGPGLTVEQQYQLVQKMVAQHMPTGAKWLASRDGKWAVWGDPRAPRDRAEWARLGITIRKSPVRMKNAGGNEIEATSQIVAKYIHPVPGEPLPFWVRRPDDKANAPSLFVHERCKETIHSMLSWVKLENRYDGPDHGADCLRYSIIGARHHAIPLLPTAQRREHEHQAAPKNPQRLRESKLRGKGGKSLDLGVR